MNIRLLELAARRWLYYTLHKYFPDEYPFIDNDRDYYEWRFKK